MVQHRRTQQGREAQHCYHCQDPCASHTVMVMCPLHASSSGGSVAKLCPLAAAQQAGGASHWQLSWQEGLAVVAAVAQSRYPAPPSYFRSACWATDAPRGEGSRVRSPEPHSMQPLFLLHPAHHRLLSSYAACRRGWGEREAGQSPHSALDAAAAASGVQQPGLRCC